MIDDSTLVTVVMPVGLVRQMIGPWYLVKKDESEQVRAAMRHSISWVVQPIQERQGYRTPDQVAEPESEPRQGQRTRSRRPKVQEQTRDRPDPS